MMYRAVTWVALKKGIAAEHAAIGSLARQSTIKEAPGNSLRFLIGAEDVTDSLRLPEVDRNVSRISQVPEVREALVDRQRALAQQFNIVVVGRDIGTVVLPKAALKIFLTASSEERSRRRHEELRQHGTDTNYETVLEETKLRDTMDSKRELSPLKPAHDAILLDTSTLSIDQVVGRIMHEYYKKHGHAQ